MIDREVADEVATLDLINVVTVNATSTPFTRCREVPHQDRYLWVTIPLHMIQPYSKPPTAVLDFGVTWTDWLAPGETIISSTWEIPDGLTLVDSYVTPEGVAVAWLSGGLDGERYTVTCRITTDSSPIAREDSRELQIWVSAAA